MVIRECVKMKQKLMFFYLKTGGGHRSCARSVAEYLAKHHKDAEVTLVDGLEDSPRIKKFLFEDSYRLSQNYAEWLFEVTFDFNSLPPVWKQTRQLIRLMLEDYVEKRILQDRPDKIVLFHCFFIKPVEEILKKHGLRTPIIAYVTDPYNPPIQWFASKNVTYILSSEDAKRTAIKWGIPRSRCVIYNYILNDKYSRRLPPAEVEALKKKMGYPLNRKIVLIVGGGDGIPKGFTIISSLLRKKLDAEIAMVCGKNNQLRKLAERRARKHRNLHVYGFVDFVYELINISDVVITKCGASTFMEIILQGKIPIINSYLGNQEVGNKDYVVDNKLGFYEPRVYKLVPLIKRIFSNPAIRETIHRNQEAQHLRNGTPDVSEYIYRFQPDILDVIKLNNPKRKHIIKRFWNFIRLSST
jgi:UDP-N-acetylglucosamine:LPS N-acetylglucosamine transferase